MAFTVVYDANVLRYSNGFHTLDLLDGRMNVTEEALHYFKDVLLLAHSDVFLGPMGSNLSRLVAELAQAWRRLSATPMTLGGGYIVWP